MFRNASHSVVIIGLFAVGGIAFAAQDRSKLKVPDGLSMAEFKGYEDWAPVAPSQVKDGIKVIAANAAMIKAYKRGLPAQGKFFPEGSKIVKLEWAPTPNPKSPYAVTVPGTLMSVSFIEKDSKRFPKTKGWAYAQFTYDAASDTLKPSVKGVDCGHACHSGVAAQDYIFTAYPKR